MVGRGWDIKPGDFAELACGRRGTVLSVCRDYDGSIICIEVGFDWYSIEDVVAWIPGSH